MNNELTQVANTAGKKLGFLIASLELEDEVKTELLSLLPSFNVEQLEKLTDILESNYLNQKTGDLDKKLEEDIKKIQADYNGELSKQEKKTNEEFDSIENDLNKLVS